MGLDNFYMLALKIKDLKYRKQYYTLEKQKLLLKIAFINLLSRKNSNKAQLKTIFLKFFRKYKLISKIRFKNRCLLTNRNKGISSKFNLSRLQLKELFQLGIVPGYTKSVW